MKFVSEHQFHPLDKNHEQKVRQEYIKLLREIADHLEVHTLQPLPALLLALFEENPASDYAELTVIGFVEAPTVENLKNFFEGKGRFYAK